MKILILVASYPPILDSAARLYSELAESLSSIGHDVTVVTQYPSSTSPVDWEHPLFHKHDAGTLTSRVKVLRVSPLDFLARIPGGKATRFLLSPLLFAMVGTFTRQPDIILIYSPPLFMGISAHIIGTLQGVPYVMNMQDIHPKLIFDSGAVKNRLLKQVLLKMESVCYKTAAAFIVYSPGNKRYLEGRQPTKRIAMIPNWIDLGNPPLAEAGESLRKEYGIEGRFVLTYGGSMGGIQGLEMVIEAADALRDRPEIAFVLAGDGEMRTTLEGMVARLGLTNVLLLPPLKAALYNQLLAASDVGLVTLSEDVPSETVPGKMADIMAKGIPILAAVKGFGDAAALIKEAACGLSVEPRDAGAFRQAVSDLYEKAELRAELGRNGRAFAEEHFSRTACAREYGAVLESMRKR